jgi:hypothetical protein
MDNSQFDSKAPSGRRSFLKKGLAAGAAGGGIAVLAGTSTVFAQSKGLEEGGGRLSKGDAALLRFAAAAEILETDFWIQYNELGGVHDSEVSGGSGNPTYTSKLQILDADFPQYIHDNTDDEFTRITFLNAYLKLKGADPVNLDQFRTLPGSTATGSSGKPRVTNLMQRTLDTSSWTRYRSSTHNPDLDPNFKLPEAVPDLSKGQFTAIPRSDADLSPDARIHAISNTAGFHMPAIEQGGNSLHPSMAERANSVKVLRILISIGPHRNHALSNLVGQGRQCASSDRSYQRVDVSQPQRPSFWRANVPDQPDHARAMPIPQPQASQMLYHSPDGDARSCYGSCELLDSHGLFIGQSEDFFELLRDLAGDADEAR